MNAQIVDIDDPRLVKALAHPIRTKILNILDQRTATPKELAAELGLPLENVSYHVRTLKDFGFIKLEKTRQVRGAVEHHYRIASRPRLGTKLWGEVPRVVQEALVDAGLNVMVEVIGRAAQQGGFDRPEMHLARYPLLLDEKGLQEVAKILRDVQGKLEAASAAAQKRVADGEGMNVTAAMFLFETPATAASQDRSKPREVAARGRRTA